MDSLQTKAKVEYLSTCHNLVKDIDSRYNIGVDQMTSYYVIHQENLSNPIFKPTGENENNYIVSFEPNEDHKFRYSSFLKLVSSKDEGDTVNQLNALGYRCYLMTCNLNKLNEGHNINHINDLQILKNGFASFNKQAASMNIINIGSTLKDLIVRETIDCDTGEIQLLVENKIVSFNSIELNINMEVPTYTLSGNEEAVNIHVNQLYNILVFKDNDSQCINSSFNAMNGIQSSVSFKEKNVTYLVYDKSFQITNESKNELGEKTFPKIQGLSDSSNQLVRLEIKFDTKKIEKARLGNKSLEDWTDEDLFNLEYVIINELNERYKSKLSKKATIEAARRFQEVGYDKNIDGLFPMDSYESYREFYKLRNPNSSGGYRKFRHKESKKKPMYHEIKKIPSEITSMFANLVKDLKSKRPANK